MPKEPQRERDVLASVTDIELAPDEHLKLSSALVNNKVMPIS